MTPVMGESKILNVHLFREFAKMRQSGIQSKMMSGSSLLAIAGAMALVVGTAACGGGGGSSADAGGVAVGGAAADGLLSGATVTAYDSNDVACKTATTAADGTYTITLPTTCFPARLVVTGGTDQMTNTTSDLELESVVTDTTQTEANISPQTTLMTYAMLDAAGGTMATLATKTTAEKAALVNAAVSNVMTSFGFGADTDANFNPLTTKLSTMTAANLQAVLRAQEATGETFRRMLSSTGNANVSTANVKSVMKSFGRDLSDGTMDGAGASTNVGAATNTVGGYDMSALRTFANTQAATVAGEILNGALTRNVMQAGGAGLLAKTTVNDANLTVMFARTDNATFKAIVPVMANLPIPTKFIAQAQTQISAASAAATALGGTAGQVANFTNLNTLFGTLTAGSAPTASATFVAQNLLTPLNTAVAGAQTAVAAVLPPLAPPTTATMTNTVNTAVNTAVQSAANFIVQPSPTLTDGTGTSQTLAPTVAAMVPGTPPTPATMTANVGTALSAANLSSVGAGGGTAPTINFTLATNAGKIPMGGGVATVTATLVDGANITRDTGERYLKASTQYNWTSNGTTITLTAPAAGIANVTYYTAAATAAATTTLTNTEADIMTVTSAGAAVPSTLKLKVASLFSRLSATSLSASGSAGNYYYKVEIVGLPVALSVPAAQFPVQPFSVVQGTISAQ